MTEFSVTSIADAAGPSADSRINAALSEYQSAMGQHPDIQWFATQFDDCHSPEAVSKIFRTQAEAFDRFSKGDEKLMKWLNLIVQVLSTFSTTLGEQREPFLSSKTIFTAIGVLLSAAKDVVASYDTLIDLFKRLHLVFQCLNSYTELSPPPESMRLLRMIMAQVLSVVVLSFKAMTGKRIKKFMNKLAGRGDVEEALSRLGELTKKDNLTILRGTDAFRQQQLRRKVQTWLSPPDPSISHNIARKSQHGGTTRWFIQSNTFREWKKNASLLWIRGKPGAGKTILCSAIIEDIKAMQEGESALIAYYYFDFGDTSKHNLRGLLASLLFQLGDESDYCWGILYRLFTVCRDGAEQPSDVALAKCLTTMLERPGQVPMYIIMDALDECPENNEIPSSREQVLDFVKDLVASESPNLFICITSRPEPDISTALSPLTPSSRRVSLHEEAEQTEDIKSYIRSFVNADSAMRRWREEDKELVINTLSERADGMFRWVFCQLDILRKCHPHGISKVLEDLPSTLDETYERALQGIPKQKQQHTRHLFQCLVASMRPLRIEELAALLPIMFDPDVAPNFVNGWRPGNIDAILSACSVFVTVTEDEGSKSIRFSHFSAVEFLTSDRLRASNHETMRYCYISPDAAHTTLARACLAVLLQVDKNTDEKHLATFPLASYAAQHWVDHARIGDVVSRIQDAMARLFDPSKPHLAAWVSIHDMDRGWHRQSADAVVGHSPWSKGTALYYAVLCGFTELARHLIVAHQEDVNAKCGTQGTPLHAASSEGHLDAVRVLLEHGANMNTTDKRKRTPLCSAHNADIDIPPNSPEFLLHVASSRGQAEVVGLLLQHNADVNARDISKWTPLHWASINGHPKVVRLLLEYGADANAQTPTSTTSLHLASSKGHLEVVQLLLTVGADPDVQGKDYQTPLQVAEHNGRYEVARLLLEHGAEVG
ncbi:hypothetical protein BC826DRAFT_951623 [Russula brevipes]|nr:hypothetical protein BC826DRAFT_951623 [Russula brevipes]